jgi:hypothetical protein
MARPGRTIRSRCVRPAYRGPPSAPAGTTVKPDDAGTADSKVSWIEAFVNDLLEPAGRKRRAQAIAKLDGAALSERELRRRVDELGAAAARERRYGAVLKAVVDVLAGHPEGMRLRDIRREVDAVLGYTVPKSSILDCFARRSESPAALFERVGYGRYHLRDEGGLADGAPGGN